MPGAELAHYLQLERQGTQLPAAFKENPEEHILHVLILVQVSQFEGHPFWQTFVVVFKLYPFGHDVHAVRLLL